MRIVDEGECMLSAMRVNTPSLRSRYLSRVIFFFLSQGPELE